MMKMKKVVIFILCFIVIAELSSCSFPIGSNGEGTNNDATISNAELFELCQELNEFLLYDYNSINVTVLVEFNGEQLKSEFKINYFGRKNASVDYHMQRYSTIDEKDGVLIFPETVITETSGSFTLTDKNITSINGDASIYEYQSILSLEMNFNAEYFTDIIIAKNEFTAKVKNPQKFLGIETNDEFSAKDMIIKTNHTENKYKTMLISYRDDSGQKISISYAFDLK